MTRKPTRSGPPSRVLRTKVTKKSGLKESSRRWLQRHLNDPYVQRSKAEGYRSLSERFGMTQEQIARAVGRERSTVANLLRLLKLPPSIRKLVKEGRLSMGHARALLSVDDPVRAGDLAKRAAEEGWSVREVERRSTPRKGPQRAERSNGASGDPVLRALEEALREHFAARVQLRGLAKGKGSIEIPFDSAEEFERVFALLTGREASEVVR